MLSTTQGIVLHNIKYGDRKIISKIYTKDFGLISANVFIGSGQKSRVKLGNIQPLTQIECVISQKENKDIQQLIEAKCVFVYTDLLNNFSKLCIAQFLNEILYKTLKEESENTELFDLICQTYQWLDKADDNYVDTHIYFLFELTKHLGFYPINNRDNNHLYFDSLEGKFSSSIQSFPLGFDLWQSEIFSQLFYHTLTNQKRIGRSERLALLDCLLSYYKMHIQGFSEIKSYRVMQEMAGD
ncbi:MAG: repair protein RecO [Bacteroidota bacterium]|jgi:DNA repair protein RecO (recombination protein O)|nr:repair protein RecO [Bacteroidota bacterium]